ncbi:hypothetical protein F5146DRAFT_999286 [Armillaria mellea]|nr:hypothetical protein F5146DRAFT_999286 [Armillaria mellea]
MPYRITQATISNTQFCLAMNVCTQHPRKKQGLEIIAFQDAIPPCKVLLGACRGDTGMITIFGSVCKQFHRLVVRIADEMVVINNYVLDDPGPATTLEMALKVFGDGGDERKRLRACSLKWKAYNVRLGVHAQVLGTLERVTVLMFIGAKLDERADVILHLPNICELFFDHCTLGFPGLTTLMQALPNLEALRTLGPGKVISQMTPFFPDTEPPLTLPTSLEYLDVDCTHMSGCRGFDNGEHILYWLNKAKNLVGLRLAMTGEVGWLPRNLLIQANRKSLFSLSLALEHPRQCWNCFLKVEAPELLELMVSVRSASEDLYFICDFFHQLRSPNPSSLTLHVHILPTGDDYPACEMVHELKMLAACIIRRSVNSRLKKLSIHWHSYQDTVAVKEYSPVFQASFDVSVSHSGIILVMKQTNHPHEMF